MHKLIAGLALACVACEPGDDKDVPFTITAYEYPTPDLGPNGFFAYDVAGRAWAINRANFTVYRTNAVGTFESVASASVINSYIFGASWDPAADALLVLGASGLYEVANNGAVRTRWMPGQTEAVRHLYGVDSFGGTWILTETALPERIVLRIDTSQGSLNAHGQPLADLNTPNYGVVLRDGGVAMVHDPVGGSSAYIGSGAGRLDPIWPCTPTCQMPPRFVPGKTGVLAVDQLGLSDVDTATGTIGARRVDYSWPILGTTMPLDQVTSSIQGQPFVLADGRVFATFRLADGTAGALMITTLDGGAWRELSRELPPLAQLEHATTDGGFWARDPSSTGGKHFRIEL